MKSPDVPTPLQAALALRESPARACVMYQSWERLLFLHWRVDPGSFQEALPPGLVVDTHDGEAWIGVVPFYMRNVRPRFLPTVPGISNFLELNVRTYVRDERGIPGVWFFSLDADSAIACTLGRLLFQLAYRDARMSASEVKDGWVDYTALRHGHDLAANYRYRGTGPKQSAEPGTLEFFLVERYLLYSYRPRSRRLYTGRVHHAPYQFQNAEVEAWSALPAAWNGIPFPQRSPDHSLFVDGIDVRIFGIEACQSH